VPSFDYGKMHKVAEDLLLKFGKYGELTNRVFTTPDPTKPRERTASDTEAQILMVITPWSKTDVSRYFNEDIIKATSKAIILWDDDNPIGADSPVTYDGKNWMVVATKPINPAGTGLIYVAALSGGA